jgi:hypothetical protein
VYSLILDSIAFFETKTGEHKATVPVKDTLFTRLQELFDDSNEPLDFADAFYSFGINYPGAITNFNYPNFLRDLTTLDGQFRDMGTVDLLWDRERDVPRYNQF